jgi:hypothetical protein
MARRLSLNEGEIAPSRFVIDRYIVSIVDLMLQECNLV